MKKLIFTLMVILLSFAANPVFAVPDAPTHGSKGTTIQSASQSAQASLPHGFVYLDEIDPSIRQSLRYYGNNNFIGHPIAGYQSSRVNNTEPF